VKQALLDEITGLTIIDTLGASEGMGPSTASSAGSADPTAAPCNRRAFA